MSLKSRERYLRIAERLERTIKEGRLSHAYIIEGDRFSEKTDFSLDLAKAILCKERPGVGCDKCRTCKMIAAGSYRDLYRVGTEEDSVKDKDIEEVQGKLSGIPLEEGARNIAIIEDGDLMTVRAQNRLLKSLEEPHPGTVIMVLAENSEKLLPTIRSRCQMIRLYSDGLGLSAEDDEYMELAKTLINLAERQGYYFEINNAIRSGVKNREDALSLLDAMERAYREKMLDSGDPNRCRTGIMEIENTRRDLIYNINEKYALGNLMLKIGG